MTQNCEELCLELTYQCPLNCLHCSSESNSYHQEMLTQDECKATIKEFAMSGGTVLELSGGEPLLYPFLMSVISFAKSLGLEVRLYTSGSTIIGGALKPIPDRFLEEFANIGLDKIIFSLQSSKYQIHEYITQTSGSFANAISSIKKAKSNNLWVGTHFVPMKLNYKDLQDVIILAAHLMVDEIGVLRFVSQGRGQLNSTYLQLSDMQFYDVIRELATLIIKFKDQVRIRAGCPLNFCSLFDNRIKANTCVAGNKTCTVSASGNVYPCPAFKHSQKHIAGNIRSNSFQEIWKSSGIWEEFRSFSFSKLNGVCSVCDHVEQCQGRCGAQRILSTGNLYNGPDPGCPLLIQSGSTCNDRSIEDNILINLPCEILQCAH